MNALAIRELPPLRVAAVEHDGPYLEIGRAFDRLFGILVPRGLVRAQPRLVGIYLNDPTAVPQAKLRSRAGLIVDDVFPIDAEDFAEAAIEGGLAAITHARRDIADRRLAMGELGRAAGAAA